jgi:hypothetical protein
MLAVAQLADQFQLLVVGAFDHLNDDDSVDVVLLVVMVRLCGFFSWNEKAGR